MQFAVEDIEIPKGIKHEAAEEEHAEIAAKSPTSPELAADAEIVMNTVNERGDVDGSTGTMASETRHSILAPSMQHRSLDELDRLHLDRDDANTQDLCPWTTYHGGMVLEDDDGRCVGNEVYFVGLIDILQKYNKRKKLENWIKSVKYEQSSISSVPPDLYAQRMHDFFEDKVV